MVIKCQMTSPANKLVSPENMHIKVALHHFYRFCVCVYAYTYIYAARMDSEQRDHKFKREKGGVYDSG